MTDASQTTTTRSVDASAPEVGSTIDWLSSEFPGWSFQVDETATWEGDLRPLWLARRPGHHPQAELSPAKLHTRLTDYLDREERRRPQSN